MRALAVLVLLAAVAYGDEPRTTPAGFDHAIHDRDLFTGGKDPVPCARCHLEKLGKLVGKPDHNACFTGCHGGTKPVGRRGMKSTDPTRDKVCTTCHAEAALAAPFTGALPVGYPPYTTDVDFGISIGHKQHAAVACDKCHADPERKQQSAPHARCAGCHDGATGHGPPMSKCVGCHPAAAG